MEQVKFHIKDDEVCKCFVRKHWSLTPEELLAQVKDDVEANRPWFAPISKIEKVCRSKRFPKEIAAEVRDIIFTRAAKTGSLGDTIDDQITTINYYLHSENDELKTEFLTSLIHGAYYFMICSCDDIIWAAFAERGYASNQEFLERFTKNKISEFKAIEEKGLTYEGFRAWYRDLMS